MFVIRFPRGYCEAPWQESFCFQTPAGCVLLRVYLENINAEGVMQVHQVQVMPNLAVNGDHESLTGGNPDLITGWVNDNLDPGDTQASSGGGGIIHSGAEAMQWNVGASTEGMAMLGNITTIGNFLAQGVWAYGDGTECIRIPAIATNYGSLQQDLTTIYFSVTSPAQWAQIMTVFRARLTQILPSIRGNTPNPGYTDDYYCVELDNVSLTVTPASEANSLEAGGIRVDGRDTVTQPVTALLADIGGIRCNARPRHEAGDVQDFGQGSEVIFDAFEDANNYIRLYRTNNLVTLGYNASGGGFTSANWNDTGAWDEDVDVAVEVRYGAFGAILYIDGVERINIPGSANRSSR